eukprot:CAMPEP_0119374156 /NCGR_PEP_ID=MMETSP1334-20130426/29460_1 /TAXON_ID=127549 /ORGANISM="Calcidiscus leptoporus, Strain RCC1130" /LENGTH=188 /DNA_ID=CAMNT_0007392149 /DNA_START=957 /DNA_END=1523 /DNA_ORIENTATION=-
MNAKDFILHNGSERQRVEQLLELFPQLHRVSSLAFVVEAVDAVDRCTLVVPTQQPDLVWVLDFERHEKEHATLAHSGHGRRSRPGKGSEHLAGALESRAGAAGRSTGRGCHQRSVAALQLQQHWLSQDNLLCTRNECHRLLIDDLHTGPRPCLLHCEQTLDDGVDGQRRIEHLPQLLGAGQGEAARGD